MPEKLSNTLASSPLTYLTTAAIPAHSDLWDELGAPTPLGFPLKK